MAKRIQRKRGKGWRMPAGAIYVGRPTKWGNPYIPDEPSERQEAVDLFREWWLQLAERGYGHDISELRGKDLACWCPLDQPCHADVLLKLANSEESPHA